MRRSILKCSLLMGLAISLLSPTAIASEGTQEDPVVVASKTFPESYVLAELLSQLLEADGFVVDRKFGLSGTNVCYEGLINDEIDVYPEYTGTLAQAVLKLDERLDYEQINYRIAHLGIEGLEPFGFNNTYAMALRRELSIELGLTRVSQLIDHPDLKVAVTHEFLEREDGWPHLQRIYGLTAVPQGIEHALALRAIADGSIDITDGFSTDAELQEYDIVLLEDDRGAFPLYHALPLIRSDLSPAIHRALDQLGSKIDEPIMLRLNRDVVVDNKTFAEVANSFLVELGLASKATNLATGRGGKLTANVIRHLQLTGIALLSATLLGLLVSLAVYRVGWLSRGVVYICGLMQTIPSIALLALMIPLLGIGMKPAIAALFLYSLLPIVRNTVTSLSTTDPMLVRVAEAMGMSQLERLRYVLVPLAMPSVFAGIRTSAVICIGTATLAAFIGAGGLGDPIVTGLALNDTGLILQGAIPAALLAVATELIFEGLERLVIPGHLKVFGAKQAEQGT
ncbi:MAG: ABC transporter permease subunit [Gammaproteobacteria bacterium]|nr:ABC transporter permease subunit [Gammaproteobacteria bacterium]